MEREEEIKLQESLPVLGTVGSMVSQEEGWVAFVPVKPKDYVVYFSMTEDQMHRVSQDGQKGVIGFRSERMNELAEMEFPKGHPWLKIRDVLKAELVRAVQAENSRESVLFVEPKKLGDMNMADFRKYPEEKLLRFSVVLEPSGGHASEWMKGSYYDMDFSDNYVSCNGKRVDDEVLYNDLQRAGLRDWDTVPWWDRSGIASFDVEKFGFKEGLEVAMFSNGDTDEFLQVVAGRTSRTEDYKYGKPVIALVGEVREESVLQFQQFLDHSVLCDKEQGLGFESPNLAKILKLEDKEQEMPVELDLSEVGKRKELSNRKGKSM